MSYTKEIFEEFLLKPVNKIKSDTIRINNCSKILRGINNLFIVRDSFIVKNSDCGALWNEICIDALSVVNSAFSGFYRNAMIGLRSIYEMGCSSIFYYDHSIEYYMFQKENMKADKYVSSLVNDYNFFKTKYIRAFYKEIDSIQSEEDSISKYLIRLYAELSDVLHGRYCKLSNIDNFGLEYNQQHYKEFETLFDKTINILLLISILRFDILLDDQDEIYRKTGVIKNE